VRPADLLLALGLPEATRLHKRVYKKLFTERADLRPADARVFTEAVGTITWAHTLKPATLPVAPFRDDEHEYDEIAVIELELSDRRAAARVAELVHRTIPYPLLLLSWDAAGLSLSAAPKRLHRQDRSRVVLDAVEATPWLDGPGQRPAEAAFVASLALSGLPQAHLQAVYTGWVQRILALECAGLSGRFDLPPGLAYAQRRAALEACREQARALAALRAELRAEDSFARKLELNVQIKQLDAALRAAAATL
jgi:hypothetical protein